MSILNFFKKETNEINEINKTNTISLEKHKISLEKVAVNLSKTTNINFNSLKSRVKLALDYSGSMDWMYNNGKVQEVINRLLPLALKFDDDGEMECYLFSNGHKEIQPCNINNYSNYINKVIKKSSFSMGGTQYASVLDTMRKKVKSDIPDFIIFITDGDNSDQTATDSVIRQMSTDNCFIMFVGIGNAKFSYLEKLDNLSGRKIDNTGFVKFSDISNVSDEELYTKFLSEYSNWLKIK